MARHPIPAWQLGILAQQRTIVTPDVGMGQCNGLAAYRQITAGETRIQCKRDTRRGAPDNGKPEQRGQEVISKDTADSIHVDRFIQSAYARLGIASVH